MHSLYDSDFNERMNKHTLAFLELLSEPKMGKLYIKGLRMEIL